MISCHYNVGKAIRRAQAIADVNDKWLANALSSTPEKVSKWREQEDMKVSRVVQLSAIFNMSVDDFLALGR